MPEQKARFRDELLLVVMGIYGLAIGLWSYEFISQRATGILIAIAGVISIFFRARLGSYPQRTWFNSPLSFGPLGYLACGVAMAIGGICMAWTS